MTQMLEQTFHLALSRNGNWRLSGRMSRGLPSLKPGEVAMALTIRLPDALFKKPSLRATVDVPSTCVSAPVIDSKVVDNIREVVSQQLGIEMTIAVVEPTTETATS